MKAAFRVQVRVFSKLLEIPGARSSKDFSALLDALDFGDQSGVQDHDMRELCIMSLQDREPEEAAYFVLKHDVGGMLRDGQLRHMATEMLEEKLWEEYPDASLHERLFNAGSLLYEALPRHFPEPDAVRVQLEVAASNASAREVLASPVQESFLVRLLANGMDQGAVLRRVYDEQLASHSFPEAAQIIWTFSATRMRDDMNFEVVGSGYWLNPLRDCETYDSSAHADETPERRRVSGE